MKLVVSENTDVYFNLAAEDYFLHHSDTDILMLWRSKSAVVCGKHQNLCAEMNYGFCMANEIQVARRLSGGGTVYHDLGNINFSFIHSIGDALEKAIDFKRFLLPVKAWLNALHIPAEFSARNDLFIHDKKVSGNAEHLFQKNKRVIHHGTLLFDSDLGKLGMALKPDGKYTDKAVKSTRSAVCNIVDFTKEFKSTESFMEAMATYFMRNEKYTMHELDASEISRIKDIRDTKYATKDWILGYSPKYTVEKNIKLKGQEYILFLKIEKNTIDEITLRDTAGILFFESELQQIIGKVLSEKTEALFFEVLRIPVRSFLLY